MRFVFKNIKSFIISPKARPVRLYSLPLRSVIYYFIILKCVPSASIDSGRILFSYLHYTTFPKIFQYLFQNFLKFFRKNFLFIYVYRKSIIYIGNNAVFRGVIKISNNFYSYSDLSSDIEYFCTHFSDLPVFSIGKSLSGREIYAVKLGSGARRLFLSGAYHGTEHLTAKVLMSFAADIACGKASDIILDDISLYIVPMVNPDGNEIAATGVYWQSNARGVDINHNFDALWELSKQALFSAGIDKPGATKYPGAFPESEPETRAVADFTRSNRFDSVMALHSQGEVIYYDFCGIGPDGTEEYLSEFERVSRYRRDTAIGVAAYGGFKDWFIKMFRRPGFTLEIGLGENPLPLSDFDNIYKEVFPILQAYGLTKAEQV